MKVFAALIYCQRLGLSEEFSKMDATLKQLHHFVFASVFSRLRVCSNALMRLADQGLLDIEILQKSRRGSKPT